MGRHHSAKGPPPSTSATGPLISSPAPAKSPHSVANGHDQPVRAPRASTATIPTTAKVSGMSVMHSPAKARKPGIPTQSSNARTRPPRGLAAHHSSASTPAAHSSDGSRTAKSPTPKARQARAPIWKERGGLPAKVW